MIYKLQDNVSHAVSTLDDYNEPEPFNRFPTKRVKQYY